LGALAAHVSSDPNYLSTLKHNPQIALHSPSKSGGKIWIGSANPTGVHVQWGKQSGNQGASKNFPLSECIGNNPVLELQERMCAKITKGYTVMPQGTDLP
jgi:hypothetical protein